MEYLKTYTGQARKYTKATEELIGLPGVLFDALTGPMNAGAIVSPDQVNGMSGQIYHSLVDMRIAFETRASNNAISAKKANRNCPEGV